MFELRIGEETGQVNERVELNIAKNKQVGPLPASYFAITKLFLQHRVKRWRRVTSASSRLFSIFRHK